MEKRTGKEERAGMEVSTGITKSAGMEVSAGITKSAGMEVSAGMAEGTGIEERTEIEEKTGLEEIYETIADMIEDHVLVCDEKGHIVFSNKAMQSYLGYSGLELKQKSFFSIVADNNIDKARKLFSNISSAGGTSNTSYTGNISCASNMSNINSASSVSGNGLPEVPSRWQELLFKGRHNAVRLHVRAYKMKNLVYIYGNEKYAEYERIRKKLDIEIANAVKIHNNSLPEHLPSTESISFASLYLPEEELGGDLFDAFKVDNGLLNDYFEQYVCFLADVSGHGLDSAMLSIFIKDTIRSYFRLKHIPGLLLSPKDIMHFFVEQYKKEGYPDEYLVCLFIAVFDLKVNELTYCNAGIHTCPLLVEDKGRIIELSNAGLPISAAIDEDMLRYEDYSLGLSLSMTLFIMSDGLPEQKAGNEYYDGRLRKLLTEIHRMEPAHIVKRVHEDFTDFLGHEKIKDDITLVVAKLL